MESLLAGADLEIRDLPYDLLVSNPRDPERGHVYIGTADGHAAWKHAVWNHFGSLTDPDCPRADAGEIAGKIISALTG